MYKVKISVRSLVESMLRTGDIGGEFAMLSPERAQEGSRVHRLHQKMRKDESESYESEVFLREVFDFEDLEVTVEGRADGIFPGKYIEEIKSTYKNLADLEENYNILHWAQVKFYGYFYLKKHSLEDITLKLTYFRIDSEEFISFDKDFSFKELEEFVFEVLNNFVRFQRLSFKWRELRNMSIKELNFPFSNYRPGQREMAVHVYNTIRENRKIFVQAPTGTGKTISTLFPAVKALRGKLADRIFYLTPKSTGKSIGEEAVRIMRDNGAKLRSITLTSKEKICFMEEVKCEVDYCPYAKGYYDRVLDGILDILENEDSLNRDVIERYALNHKLCPFEFSLDLSLYADIIIGDYNYAFDPRVYLKRFFDEKQEKYIFLLDEVHNLLDRARMMFSQELRMSSFLKIERSFKLQDKIISKKAAKVAEYLEGIRSAIINEGRSHNVSYDINLTQRVLEFTESCEKYLADETKIKEREDFKTANKEENQEFMDLFFDSRNFLKVVEVYTEGHRSYAMVEGEDLMYKLFAIDPSRCLKDTYHRADSIIFFSATLTPMEYYMSLYGADKEDYRVTLPSPFPRENLKVYVDLSIDTRYKKRDSSYGDIAENLKRMVESKKGNYIAFFPSYSFMSRVYEIFNDLYGDSYEVSKQESGLSEIQREEVIKSFNNHHEKSYLYFMVLGGVFAEGIDLKGDDLIGTALIGLGYPTFDFERELIQEYFDENKGQGFDYAYNYPGLNKITQAGGRVIRSENDMGMILLMDSRYKNTRIRQLLPEHWFPLRDGGEMDNWNINIE